LCHGIHLHLLGVLHEYRNYHGILLGYVGCQFQEAVHLLLIVADVHGSPREHVGGTDQYGKSYLFHELVHLIITRKLFPPWLVDTQPVEHGRKFVPVLCPVYRFG